MKAIFTPDGIQLIVEPDPDPEPIPLADAVAVCKRISDEQHRHEERCLQTTEAALPD